MLRTCEVIGCGSYPEHNIGVGQMVVGVCESHRKATRALSRKYAVKLLNATADLHDEFQEAVCNLKEKK